jgi:hypothetical protein
MRRLKYRESMSAAQQKRPDGEPPDLVARLGEG